MNRSRFHTWLLKQKRRDDPVGDLAKDVAEAGRDSERFRSALPAHLTADSLRDYVLQQNLHYPLAMHVHDAIEAAVAEYEQAHPRVTPRERYRDVGAGRRFAILQRDKFTCQTCGARAPDVRLEIDHRVAIAAGGDNSDGNLWTLCHDCNRGKGAQCL